MTDARCHATIARDSLGCVRNGIVDGRSDIGGKAGMAMEHEWRRGAYAISTEHDRLDFDVLHSFLTTSYWSPGITREAVKRAAGHALVFGLYYAPEERAEQQVGYARVLTDYVALAYILDVFVLEPHKRQGLARWLMETILTHPHLRDVRSWLLKTCDAHGLYEKLGFVPPADLERFLRRSGGE